MDSISQDLEKVWSQLEAKGISRASLFNLVIVSPDNERQEYLKQIIHNVIERFPCRILQILISNTTELKVRVFATTTQEIACDTIEIETPILELSKIPFLILPHFLPDLPIYLLWAADPTVHPSLLRELQKWVTRFIYDSETAGRLPLFASTLLSLSQETGKEVADLNWARIESWRELFAATFYSEDRLKSLKQAKTIDIHYNAAETPFFCHTKIQALYLMAWLKARLSFSPTITFHPQKNNQLPPGAIVALDILCNDQTHFSFHRDPTRLGHIRALICDEEKCEIPSFFVFSKTLAGLSLANQIYHADLGSHFPQVLKILQDPLCPFLMPG